MNKRSSMAGLGMPVSRNPICQRFGGYTNTVDVFLYIRQFFEKNFDSIHMPLVYFLLSLITDHKIPDTLHNRGLGGLFWKGPRVHREPRLVSQPMNHDTDIPDMAIAVNSSAKTSRLVILVRLHGDCEADRAHRRDDSVRCTLLFSRCGMRSSCMEEHGGCCASA